MVGAFSVHGFNEQMFGADEQVPGRVKATKGYRPEGDVGRRNQMTVELALVLVLGALALWTEIDARRQGSSNHA
jgi:hypothetical protein